ncbi:MAG: peptide chain release factor N(5)-glutamine methyltransferase [Clostridia bacterium]|nr:peptide chain release factor N(5)-glutamine methyltransferase [Clostridia bacterium]MBQ9774376.1 peptide chain release factor N(5)-glutamine methyltransferase [Clostridia bacterium]
MTYRELCARLRAGGIENAEWDAACLIEHFCGAELLSLRADPDRAYYSERLEDAVARRLTHTPLQYLLGEWTFYRQTYEVSPDCLIPRADTEILVEEAIRRLPTGARFADLCTGSGCIAVSTLAERPDTHAIAIEKFPQTLAIAERNADRNGVRARCTPMLCDVLSPSDVPNDRFDALLSNPPYIATGELPTLSPEVHAEPREALDGGEDGLLFYRAILGHWTKTLKKDGFILFEIGYDQADAVSDLGRAHGFCATVRKDLGGNDRVVVLTRTDAGANAIHGKDLQP